MKKLLLMLVLYLHISESQHPEARSLKAGSPEKPDLLEKAEGDNGRTYDLKHAINIAQGTDDTSHGSHSTARGGGALIPVYAGAANKNHHRNGQHSGRERPSCSRVGILVTTVLISFSILI